MNIGIHLQEHQNKNYPISAIIHINIQEATSFDITDTK